MPASVRLAAYYFAFFCYAGAMVPYFPLWLAATGFESAQIALVLAMPQVARIFAPALWGWLADAWGARFPGVRRAIVVFSSLAVIGGLAALYAVQSAAGAAAAMFAMGVLSAGAIPLVEAITLATLAGRTGLYGPIRLWGSVGFILGVLGTGAWLDAHGPRSVLDAAVAFSLLALAAACALPAGGGPPPVQPGPQRFAPVLARTEVLAFFGACVCMALAHGALYAFFSIHLEQLGYPKTLIGALWTAGVVAEIVLFLFLPQLLRRFSLRSLLVASFACAAARFLAIGWGAQWLTLLAAAQLLHAVTFGAFHAASVAAAHRLFPGRLEGRGQALYSSLTYGLGGALGTLLAGWTWSELGAAASFAASALFGALGGALIAWKVRV
jgi:PPP family 3-phenylpropionic acid transporter